MDLVFQTKKLIWQILDFSMDIMMSNDKFQLTKPEIGFVNKALRLLKLVNTAIKTPLCFSEAQRIVITPIAAKSAP